MSFFSGDLLRSLSALWRRVSAPEMRRRLLLGWLALTIAIVATNGYVHKRLRIYFGTPQQKSESVQVVTTTQQSESTLAKKPSFKPIPPKGPPAVSGMVIDPKATAKSAPLRADLAQGDRRPRLLSLVDEVSIYRRNGIIEVYGASLRERRGHHPIDLDRSELLIDDSDAWLIWTPERPVKVSPKVVRTVLSEPIKAGQELSIILELDNADTYRFTAGVLPKTPLPRPHSQGLETRPEPVDWYNAAVTTPLTQGRSVYQAPLPPKAIAAIARGAGIREFAVRLRNANGTLVTIKQISLMGAVASAPEGNVTISGAIEGIPQGLDSSVTLVDQDGKRADSTLAPDGTFAFADLVAGRSYSVRFVSNFREYYATLGRWFVVDEDRSDLIIIPRAVYQNPERKPSDRNETKFLGSKTPLKYAAIGPSHVLMRWTGAARIQEYDSLIFNNNAGYYDRDHFFENVDGCFRVFSHGSSTVDAIQVNLTQHVHTLLEEELGFRLGRCVEVIGASTSNGDIGSANQHIRDYGQFFNPDIILLENEPFIMTQLEPEMARAGLGWDKDHRPKGWFIRAADGSLTYHDRDPKYSLYLVKATSPEYVKGVPFVSTFNLPYEYVPPIAKKALDWVSDITNYYTRTFPHSKIVLHGTIRNMGCKGPCAVGHAEIPGSDKKVDFSFDIFVDWMKRWCSDRKFNCIYEPSPKGYDKPGGYLSWDYDGHPSVTGHQWMARVFAERLKSFIPESDATR